jgi:hypothetical protein
MPIDDTAWDKAKYGKYEVLDSVRDAFEEAGVKLSVTFKVIESLDGCISLVWRWE